MNRGCHSILFIACNISPINDSPPTPPPRGGYVARSIVRKQGGREL
jgi:hypothetical protein